MIVVFGPPLCKVHVNVNGDPWSTYGSSVIVMLNGWSKTTTWLGYAVLEHGICPLSYPDQCAWKIQQSALRDPLAMDP